MKKSALILLVVSFLANVAVAQNNIEYTRLNPSAAENLIMALNSDNTGLKRNAVYFAGHYKINEAVEQLEAILQSSETDLSLKTLAAYSLHQIGSEECIDALKEAAKNNSDEKLCRKCKLMCEDLIQAKSGISYQ